MPFKVHTLSPQDIRLELNGCLVGPDEADRLEGAIASAIRSGILFIIVDGERLEQLDAHCRAALLAHFFRLAAGAGT